MHWMNLEILHYNFYIVCFCTAARSNKSLEKQFDVYFICDKVLYSVWIFHEFSLSPDKIAASFYYTVFFKWSYLNFSNSFQTRIFLYFCVPCTNSVALKTEDCVGLSVYFISQITHWSSIKFCSGGDVH